MYTAIIGISCKFPGANDYAEYWENLATGKSSITEIPKKRWDWKACWGNPQKEKNKSQSKWGGFIRQVDAFDMNFFGLTPKVVQTMDPQQRIMLELAWACFEDAGIPPSSVKGSKIGVFLGVFNHDYKELQESGDLDIEAHHSTGTATAVIPNRVSHYFSLMGPSIPIDTACSGSLNAIHSAIQAIEYGDCEMALAGGINLLLTPTRHISFSKMGMLSPTGSCKTFDDSADGYVRGEGAGVLLLKPLEKALADGDSIHAVIKGSAVNHCGKTYTLTFPNPEAQADVIVSAHQRAGIPANTVGYIEAHGTGTPKGDPLEFKGLLSAFETLSGSAGAPPASQTAWCGLGSVKTNIGHLEAAAGVAGVIKVAMSLQHKQLPPLHNYSKLNSRITIEDTPFYIVDKLQEWRPSVENAPLRAGISSFGFGGTNSHVVLEEAPAVERVKGEQPAWYLICLSAKTEVALDRKRRDLLAWLEKDNGETDLLSISATLLLGRDHFDFRKAYVVKSLAELRENLNVETEIPENTFESSFLKAQPEAEKEGAEGRRKAAERALALFASGKALSPGSCRKVMSILAKLYVLGEELYVLGEGLEWQPLFSRFGKGQIQRVHLPTYPFARDRCWIEGGGGNGKLRMENGEFFSKLHPLVHCNVSTLEEQCFSSTFSGDEFFLSDHKVRGRAVLPEVAILEMAREAVARATATLDGKQNSVCLRDVVWVKPVLVPTVVDSAVGDSAVVNSAVVNSESPKAFYIGVYPENSGHNGSAAQSRNNVGFEVFSKTGADDITVYCQGGALVGDDVEPSAVLNKEDSAVLNKKNSAVLNKEDSADLNEFSSSIDLSALKAEFQQNSDLTHYYPADQCYQAFADMGLEYGEAFRSIETICFNANGDQCLAKLSLPAVVSEKQRQFVIHPSIADAAVQVAIAFASGIDQVVNSNPVKKATAVKPFMPLMLQGLTVVERNYGEKFSSQHVWAWVRTSEISEKEGCWKFDIDLCDAQGEIYVQMEGLTLQRNKESTQEIDHGALLLQPAWEEQDVGSNASPVQYGEQIVVLCESDISEEINIPGAVCLALNEKSLEGKVIDIDQRFQLYARKIFEEVQKILKHHPKDKVLFQVVVPLHGEQQVLTGIAGLLSAARKENSKFVGQLIGIGENETATSLMEKLDQNSRSPVDQEIQYKEDKRSVSVWHEVDSSKLGSPRTPWKDNGIYLITGGMGGLGLIFAREIAQKVKGARVILTGRSVLSKEKEKKIEALRKLEVHAEYKQVDVSRLSELSALLESIQKEFGGLQGIIHCAGLFQVNMITMKKLEELNSTLAPKVSGVVNLDKASKDIPLDFVIYCSSIASYLGNSGLADYAAANAFMDVFARYRNQLAQRKERSGQTLSINWPVWKEGGIQVGSAAEEMLHQQLGSVPMTTATGIQALYKALVSGRDQILVMEGEVDKIRRNLLSCNAAKKSEAIITPSPYEILSPFKASSVVSRLFPKNTNEAVFRTFDSSELDVERLKPKLLAVLTQKASEVLGVDIGNIKAEAELNSYGFDSVLLVGFANQLNDEYNTKLNAPVFFEHRTLVALTQYMLEEYAQEIAAYFGLQTKKAEPASAPMEAESVGILDAVSSFVSKRQRFKALSLAANQGERFYSATANGSFSTTANGLSLKEEVILSSLEYSPKAHLLAYPLAQKEAEKRNSLQPSAFSLTQEPIAIIGISGRFPMAEDVNEFWENLLEGRDCISEVPKSRWDWEAIYGDPTEEGNKTNVKWGGFIEGVDEFDPLFFNISPHEAELMDPQHRLLMTYVWKVIEDAGYSAQSLAGSNTAIYVGTENSNYASLVLPGIIEGYSLTSQACAVGPNRMSFFLDFHGPSEPIDTACSSSLVAAHKAVTAIRGGNCEVAIIGGINTMLTQEGYIARSKAGMLSADGRCKTFSDQANGYVPGEGVGMLFLKRLSAAEKDGDHIYGLIRGTAENHGGRSNSLTAPNPVAQAELLKTAYTQAGIDPRTISYIEAHGTGTPLGDPIEINGLKTAFKDLYKSIDNSELASSITVPHCGIGAVKSNIGHLELAAGVAGIIKVLLQLKHKTLVKSLHSETINPYIQLEGSPFYVVQEAKPWEPINDIHGNKLPRRAGVSSFGFGGVNAHVIIEEYVSVVKKTKAESQEPKPIILSAKNETRLLEQAKGLLKAISTQNLTDSDLTDIAYTLQVGRDAMDERLAILATSIDSLKEKLQAFVEGKENIEGLFRGKVTTSKDSLAILADDADMAKTIEAWVNKGKYEKVLGLWVQGLAFDWKQLYEKLGSGNKPCRISLPSYPFARDRYWLVRKAQAQENREPGKNIEQIHPLLHRNTSTLSELRFSSVFNAEDSFLGGYRVKGHKVVPAAVYFEMARAALAQADENSLEEVEIQLSQVEWGQPLVLGVESTRVHISVFPASENSSEIAFEIYGEPVEIGGDSVLYARGYSVTGEGEAAEPLDLPGLQSLCREYSYSQKQCYQSFKAMKLEVSAGFQCIDTIFVGKNQVLAKLLLSNPSLLKGDELILDPRLLDSAFQAVLAIATQLDNPQRLISEQLIQITALDTLDILAPCASAMWTYIRYSDSNSDKESQKLDIDICDEQGNICVRMRGCSLSGMDIQEEKDHLETLILKPEWMEQEINSNLSPVQYDERFVVLCELGKLGESAKQYIKTLLPDVDCLILNANTEEIDAFYKYHSGLIFEKIQEVFKTQNKSKILFQVIVPNQGKHQILLGLNGLISAARKENSKFIGQILCVNAKDSPAILIEKLKQNGESPSDCRIQYVDSKRLIATWRGTETPARTELSVPWKDKGIYLITGGAGALGLHCVTAIAKQVKEATVILTGRSALSQSKCAELGTLKKLGIDVQYKQVDICQKTAVISLIEGIKEEFGGLHGIIHCAGVVQVNLIVNKSLDELTKIIEPKVSGTVNLDQASKDTLLDFVIFFSSISGYLGNDGLSDYALANAFMDEYAKYRNELVAAKQRSGHTLSINWPVWKETGMETDSSTVELLRHTLGISPIETEAAMNALYISMMSGEEQTIVLSGDKEKIKCKVMGETGDSPMSIGTPTSDIIVDDFKVEIDLNELNHKIKVALVDLAARLLKIQRDNIDVDGPLNGYGFDSILLTRFANELNREYELELTPTVFFEHSSIENLARYLAQEYRTVMVLRFSVKSKTSATSSKVTVTRRKTIVRNPSALFSTQKNNSIRKRDISKYMAQEPIAIIGMSGRFPQAKDVDEFWFNLTEGKDCITEIPRSRWDCKATYGDPSSTENKCNVKWGGFIDGVDEFDPLFFSISPAEAKVMDPQHRLLLTYVWKVIEDAGYSAQSLSDRNIAIFVGLANSGYETAALNRSIESYSIASQLSAVGPNRVSYFLNFHGPSEPIDTACSSSLVAIHRAVMVINEGGCEAAIVGGVNTLLSQGLYIARDKAGMMSVDGRCKTFSEYANGYIPGEGVGMLFLKNLSMAEKDGDHIYGLIRGSAENHGGRSNSLTAPNPKAQAELLKTAYKQSGVDPRTVSYIEAHGTGTKLGDPIEIEGLKTAFRDLTKNIVDAELSDVETEPFCGLGAVKSNIGHLELAAGVAGVIKVLLQLKHKTLVKTLYSKPLNPYIQLEESPFYIVQETKNWIPIKDTKGNVLPRRAGVSSFGVGGVNAHVIIEEYMPKEQPQAVVSHTRRPEIVLLSAKNSERLVDQAQGLLKAIDIQSLTDENMGNIAYTLQVGREIMEERLAILAESIEALKQKLKAFLAGEDKTDGVYRGRVTKSKDSLIAFVADEDMASAINAWINKGKYTKLLDLWVQGMIFDWKSLYSPERLSNLPKPHRISLPTYPFANEKYWIDQVMKVEERKNHISHPLLHCNTSVLLQQRFTTTFSGKETFLVDHLINDVMVLPGVCYLEMARESITQAMELDKRNTEINIQLNNVVWVQPIEVKNPPTTIHIRLNPKNDDKIGYEIYSALTHDKSSHPADSIDNKTDIVIHGQGEATLTPSVVAPVLNLEELRESCNKRCLYSQQHYEALESIGFKNNWGPSLKGIDTIWIGSNQVLAKLSLPETADSIQDFVLHPSIMDSALQAALVLFLGEDFIPKLFLPFALDELMIYHPCATTMWCYVRYSQGSSPEQKVQRVDVDICDDNGRVCVQFKGFSSRELKGYFSQTTNSSCLVLYPQWQQKAIEALTPLPELAEHRIILCEPESDWQLKLNNKLSEQSNEISCLRLECEQTEIDLRYINYATQIFEQLQTIVRSKPKKPVLVQVVVPYLPDNEENLLFSGLSGLLKTAQLENPKLIGQLVEVDARSTPEDVANQLLEGRNALNHHTIRYCEGQRWLAKWHEVENTVKKANSVSHPWKDSGVYLITGGAGGLGLLFAEDIVKKSRGTTIILTGRSSLSDNKLTRIKNLEKEGATIDYHQVDISDKESVDTLISSLLSEYGQLNGIIHSAGVIRDGFILKKTHEELREVLAPKVTGLVNLDQATRAIALDFLVVFSSLSGVLGNTGQADYATANAFMDSYVCYRNRLVKEGLRRGRTVSIDWPLWKDGSMGMDAQSELVMQQNTGMVAMATETGFQAFYQAIALEADRYLVMEGDLNRMRLSIEKLLHGDKELVQPSMTKSSTKKSTTLPYIVQDNQIASPVTSNIHPEKKNIQKEDVANYLKNLLSSVIEVSAHKIEADESLEKYGIDSVMVVKMTNDLEKVFGSLSKTLFFEYQTISELSEYFLEAYADQLSSILGTKKAIKKSITNDREESGQSSDSVGSDVQINIVEIQREQVAGYLKKLLSPVIDLPAQKINADEPLEKYGIDSVMVVKLTNELENTFDSLSKTLFYEYQTITELSDYFLEAYPDKLAGLLKLSKPIKEINSISDNKLKLTNNPSLLWNKQSQRFSHQSNTRQQGQALENEGIAIIGISGRYPMADNLEEFWQNLREGKDCITEIPMDRWDYSLYFDEDKDKPGKTNSKWGGFINDVDKFDPLYFNISPREAEQMEPMERLFMQCAIETIQDAGYTPRTLAYGNGNDNDSPISIGVYVGVGLTEYELYGVEKNQQGNQVALLGCPAFIANRVSYFCNFSGPSFAVDTMCSSSLTAIHLACQGIYSKECEVALAGGVNISIHPNKYLYLGQGGFASSNGRCQSFGIGGDGYVPAEGVGSILLKPLNRAVTDGDHIYGVIKGSAINHGGKTNGLMVPNPNAQAHVIKRAFEVAGVNPRTISYLEAHGTGTSLGDPIEMTGLSKSFKDSTQDTQFCAIGSIKSNIGHCEAAAGISGLTKILLQMKHKQLVPSLHSETLNPNIDFETTPFVVQRELSDWEQPEIEIDGIVKRYPRIAGISSFGAGGSNAHIVVEEYIASERLPYSLGNRSAVVLVSAKNQERLKEYIKNIYEYLDKNKDVDLVSLAYTLQVGREAMDERVAFITDSLEDLMEKLHAYQSDKRHIENMYQGRVKENRNTLEIFTNDKAFRQTLSAWMDQGQYRKLADLWVKGLSIDWSRLYGEDQPQRISLPTYPFVKESFWISTTQSAVTSLPVRRTHRSSNERPYEQIFEEVIGKKISTDAAVTQIKSKISYRSM